MITIDEIFTKQTENYYSVNLETKKNINELLYKLNVVRYLYAKPMIVNSGFRSIAYNSKIGGARNSWHTKGLAIDISDSQHELYKFLTISTQGKQLSEKLGLYFEHELDAPTWCHIQLRAPASGSRIFRK